MFPLFAELLHVFGESSFFNLIYFFFCFNVLSPCSLLIWHCCRAHLFHGKCEMISVLTDINKLPDPINKLLVVSCLALSHANLAIAGQVQIYWGRNQRRSSVCLCVFLRRHAQCLYAESKSLYICTTCKWSVTAQTPELQLNLFSPDVSFVFLPAMRTKLSEFKM